MVKANKVTRGNSSLGDSNWRSGKLLCETHAWASSRIVASKAWKVFMLWLDKAMAKLI